MIAGRLPRRERRTSIMAEVATDPDLARQRKRRYQRLQACHSPCCRLCAACICQSRLQGVHRGCQLFMLHPSRVSAAFCQCCLQGVHRGRQQATTKACAVKADNYRVQEERQPKRHSSSRKKKVGYPRLKRSGTGRQKR